MGDQPSGPLVETARKIGSAAGKIVSAVTGAGGDATPAKAEKANLWAAEYVGSGTFIVHKPKRKEKKRRQTALHSRKRGMRK